VQIVYYFIIWCRLCFQPGRLSEVYGGRVTGIALCPFSPLQNSTSLMTSLDDLYTATVTDFTARDPAIYRALGPSMHLRTVQYNSRWLNGKPSASMQWLLSPQIWNRFWVQVLPIRAQVSPPLLSSFPSVPFFICSPLSQKWEKFC